jgi:hypothetical protein
MFSRLAHPILAGSKLPHRPRTIKPLQYEKTNSCSKMLGNGLMNDAWLGQTVDSAKTGQTSLNI